jgi:hypothetical protein
MIILEIQKNKKNQEDELYIPSYNFDQVVLWIAQLVVMYDTYFVSYGDIFIGSLACFS